MFNLQPVVAAHLIQHSGTQTRPLRSALELRYQVYCVEYSFLEPGDYPDGVETDEHDDEAAHFHAFDADDELAGYVRLVKPDAEQRFPLQRHCGSFAAGLDLPNPAQAAEISRLMVRSEFRRRRGHRLAGVTAAENNAILSGQRRLDTPQILLGLYKQMYLYSLAHGIRYWYAAMEQPLARSLARSGFVFEPIGPETHYYGPVSPYLADLTRLESSVGMRSPDLLAWLRNPVRSPAPVELAPLAN